MASVQVSVFLSALFLPVFLASPAYSLTCTSQKFTKNQVFTNCTDLPQLKAYLHYTYDASNSSLSVAFIATPAKPEGWVSYGINPTATGMAGAQALVAFKDNKSVMTVKTYNLISYHSIKESKLSFDVWDLSAEDNKGQFTIFAKLKVPAKIEKLNQVWQVGSEVKDGTPMKHAFAKENLDAKSPLQLAVASGTELSPAPAPGTESPHGNGGVQMTKNLGFLILLPLLFTSLLAFH